MVRVRVNPNPRTWRKSDCNCSTSISLTLSYRTVLDFVEFGLRGRFYWGLIYREVGQFWLPLTGLDVYRFTGGGFLLSGSYRRFIGGKFP